MKLHLRPGLVRSWHHVGATWARGTAYASDGRVLDGAALAAYLDADAEHFTRRVADLGGSFAAIQTSPTIQAATDRIRSIPLFYGRDADGTLHLGEDARALAEDIGARLDDPLAAAEFMLASATTGPSTLCSAVRQVQAAEVVSFHDPARPPQSVRYALYGSGDRSEVAEPDLVAEGVRLFEDAFDQFLASVAGHPLVVPLSGGLDSRLIAAMLVRGGRTDALCFTYGRERSVEVQASRGVAEALGLDWTFVAYSNTAWHRWFASDSFQQFRRQATGLSAIEHEQDWPAVLTLKERGLPDDAVFVPGHAGDFLGGSHLPTVPSAHEADPVQWIVQRYYTEWPLSNLTPDLQRNLHANIEAALHLENPTRAFLQFGWQERQAKMIANSVRVYEHLGFDWRLPFWSSPAVFDFWGRVPTAHLRSSTLYQRVLRELMGETLYALPSTQRSPARLVGKLHRLTDRDLQRYGIWLGSHPLLSGLRTRIGDLSALDHPSVESVVAQLTEPWAKLPPQRASINGLLALAQLDTLSQELG